jgi:hypothetical protein
MEEVSILSIVENTQGTLSDIGQGAPAKVANRRGARRQRLSLDEQREVARLYADTSISTAEIRAQFAIGESSLYRVVQRQGVRLRGHISSSEARSTQPVQQANTRRSRSARDADRASSSSSSEPVTTGAGLGQPAKAGTRRRGPGRHVVAGEPRTPSASLTIGKRFRIVYQAEQVFAANDIQDALRQAESMGATDITDVTRVDG